VRRVNNNMLAIALGNLPLLCTVKSRYYVSLSLSLSVSVCVCVCVKKRETKERQRESNRCFSCVICLWVSGFKRELTKQKGSEIRVSK